MISVINLPQFTWSVDVECDQVELLFAPILFYPPLFGRKMWFQSIFSLIYRIFTTIYVDLAIFSD